MSNKNEQEIVELWKKLGVSKCEASFSCGGDSMNEMDFTYFDKGSKEIPEAKSELDDYFDDVIYDKVDFYVNSDGHYMGENGVVYIELFEDDENDLMFTYEKVATSEFYETHSTSIDIPVSNETFRFILDKVSMLSGSHSDNFEINYKVDCVVTDENEKDLKDLIVKVCELGIDWEPDTNGEYSDDSFNFELEDWDLLKEKQENTLYFNISKGYYEYCPSED